MNAFMYWLNRKLGKRIDFYCTRKGTCEHQPVQHDLRCELKQPDGAESYCFCADRSPSIQLTHRGNHFRCPHCTNPSVVCRNCGSTYMDIVEPGPQWRYLGLFKGWEHTGRCLQRKGA